jgi:hypothetical protein
MNPTANGVPAIRLDPLQGDDVSGPPRGASAGPRRRRFGRKSQQAITQGLDEDRRLAAGEDHAPQPAPRLRAYSRETVIAEKFQALVMLGHANSHMKTSMRSGCSVLRSTIFARGPSSDHVASL